MIGEYSPSLLLVSAATFLEIAIKDTADRNNHIDPEAASRTRSDRFVDDLSTGGSPLQVSRFVGCESDNFQCDGTIPTILSRGSLCLKAIVISGETNQEKISKLGGKFWVFHGILQLIK